MRRSELLMHRLWSAIRFNPFQFIKYNFLSKQVHRAKGAYIIPFWPGRIFVSKDAEVILNGTLLLNKPWRENAFTKGNLFMVRNSKLIVDGKTAFLSGYCIQNAGVLRFDGLNRIAEGSRIICANSITIGEGSGLSNFVTLRDSTSHPSGTNPDNLTVSTEPIVIGKHVWVGANSTVYQGTTIGDGAIIGNYAKVKGEISPRTMVAPPMDKEILTGVYWWLYEKDKETVMKKYYSDDKPSFDNKETVAPAEIFEKVCDVFTALGYDDNICEQEDLIGSKGINSLALLSLITELEEKFSVRISVRELNAQNFYSVGTIASLIDRLIKNNKSNSIQTAEKNENNTAQDRKPIEFHDEDADKTIVQSIFENAVKTPDKIAIITEEAQTTYRELCSMIYSYSETFRQIGVRAGDNIVLQAVRDVKFIAAFYACHLLSAVPVPVEDEIGRERILGIAGETSAPLIICNSIDGGNEIISYEQLHSKTNIVVDIPLFSLKFPELSEPSQILFTTGTTGKSKGVVQSHKSISLATYLRAREFRVKNNEVELLLSPLNHTMGINNIHTLLMFGQTLLIGNLNNEMSALVDLLRKRSATAVCTPPVFLRVLIKYKEDINLSDLNYIVIGGAPLSGTDLEMFLSTFPKTRLVSLYGATEGSPVSSAIYSEDKEVTLGHVVQYVDVKLKLENGEYTQKPDTAGLICVKSPMNMMGYYNEPELTQSIYDGEYLRLNDLAYFDEKGRLHFAGRADDVINIGGYKISPNEVEAVADGSGLLQECILINAHDKNNTEYLELLVVPKESDFSSDDLMNYIREKVEAYRVPKKITVVDSLKKTYNGKLDRKAYRV